jgi:PilZ domain-containing protein
MSLVVRRMTKRVSPLTKRADLLERAAGTVREIGRGMGDNRRTKRVRCTMKGRWLRRTGDVDGEVIDINAHGLFLRTDASIEPNTLMRIEVTLPDGPVTLLGVARFVGVAYHGRGIGVSLFAMDDANSRRWLGHYRSLITASAPQTAVHAA